MVYAKKARLGSCIAYILIKLTSTYRSAKHIKNYPHYTWRHSIAINPIKLIVKCEFSMTITGTATITGIQFK